MNTTTSDEIFTIEGSIQALRLAAGVRDLVEDITNGAFFTSVVAGMSGEYGVMANSASLAMNEGEDVEHLALLVNDTLAVGTFEWLRDLKVDDFVTLVVSRIAEGPLFVHAILRKRDQLLWTPIGIDYTRLGWVMYSIKLGGGLLGFTWFMEAVFAFFSDSALTNMELALVIISPLLMTVFVMFMSTRDLLQQGDTAEIIYRVLGVPKFERFHITPYSLCNFHFLDDPDSLKKGHIFRFAEALAAHKKKFNLC
jgi:hypothetical protein